MTGWSLGLLVRVAALAAALLFVGAERAAAQTLDELLQQRFAEERAFESRVTFDAATAALALPRMRGGATPRERAAAIVAYAASGDPRAAAVVTPLFGQLEGPEQMAALFALSALRPVPRDVLLDTSRLGDPALAPHLGVALVMTRDRRSGPRSCSSSCPARPSVTRSAPRAPTSRAVRSSARRRP